MARPGRKFNYRGIGLDDPDKITEGLGKLVEFLDQEMDEIYRNIANVEFRQLTDGAVPDNIGGRYLIYTSNAVADTDDRLNHKLGRKPVGLIQIEVPLLVGESPNSGKVYFGSENPTDKEVTLRCTGTSKRCAVLLF